MIKIKTDGVCGFKPSIKGMRKPMNSLDKSDSLFECGFNPLDDGYCDIYFENVLEEIVEATDWHESGDDVQIGPNDHELMMKLSANGSSHSKYRRFIVVYADITAPLYMLKELDTYRMGVEKNSSSTMHKIHAKEFTLDDFSCEHLDSIPRQVRIADETLIYTSSKDVLNDVVRALNLYRELFLATKDKRYWWQMIQLLPSSYNQNREYMFSYETLAKIYQERKDHKLDEWREFCEWIKNLPYSEIITLEEKESLE